MNEVGSESERIPGQEHQTAFSKVVFVKSNNNLKSMKWMLFLELSQKIPTVNV